MMAQRSLIRPDQLDKNGSYEFARLVLDGYSGGDDPDGYVTALEFIDGNNNTSTLTISAVGGAISQTGTGQVSFAGNVNATSGLDVTGADLTVGATMLTVGYADGAISQAGTGQVSFAGNVNATNGLDVTGANLTVSLDANITGNANVTGNVVITGDLTVNGTETIIHTENLYIEDPIAIFNDTGSELTSSFSGFSARDTDGYNRIGWSFDGYWGISIAASADSDANLDRALAYVGSAFTNGDLSATTDGASGADKVSVTPISGLSGSSVQTCLENLASGSAEITGTTHLTFTINSDATAGSNEDPCVIMKGGDGTSLIEGYMCLITNTGVSDDFFQFRTYDDGAPAPVKVYIGEAGSTDDLDAYLVLNAGSGATANQATIVLNGTANQLQFIANAHVFSGDVTAQNDLTVTGTSTFNGNTVIGSDGSDTVDVNAIIISNLLPTDVTYQLGDETHRWLDGYFDLFTPTNYTPVGSNYSLEGHLKGIDAALTNLDHPRAVYVITAGEASADAFDTSRTANQGTAINVSGLDDAQFRDNIMVYWNGQLLYNDAASAAAKANVQHDDARKTGDLKTLLFAGDLKKGAVIQLVDMR
jgi:hypothetical protein